MSEHGTKKEKVSGKATLSKREERKKKQKDAMGEYIYIKVYRMRCVSVGINDDTGPSPMLLEESSFVCLLFYGYCDMRVLGLRIGLERRTRLDTLEPCVAVVFLVCTQVMILTHPRRRVNTAR
jgi:hypothetical protein